MPSGNWIVIQRDHHDRDGGRRLPHGAQRLLGPSGQDDVGLLAHEVGRELRELLGAPRESEVDDDGLAVDVPELLQPLLEGDEKERGSRVRP